MERRRLYRSNSDRMIAGVCGGLADFFNIDPSVMRIIFVLFLLLGGNGLLIYLVLWLIVPLEPTA
jgi:phage shock protein C